MSDAEGKPGAPAEYVVLARRYRPSQFEQVIGQQHVTRTLQNAITAGRVHHAYLFTGSRGVGKTTVARILARSLNHPDGPTATPPQLEHPESDVSSVDVIEIDGASHTGVDDVRELRESVRYLPSQSRHKIYIIDEVHMLSTSAFNALLKTLEEPPPHVVFVFATTEPHKIPATILSRCQRFDFKRVPSTVLVEHCQRLLKEEQLAVEPGGLALIARAAEGGVRDSLSLLDQVIAYTAGQKEIITTEQVAEVLGLADRRTLFALSAAVLARDAGAALEVIEGVYRDGIDLSQFSQSFVAHLRDLIVVASCREPAALLDVTETELVDLSKQAASVELAQLQQHFDRFAHAAEEIARSTFPRLLLEMVLIELVHSEPLLPLGDLLERLESLEGRLSAGGGGGQPRGGPGRRPAGTRPPSPSRRSGAGASSAAPPSVGAAPRASSAAPSSPGTAPDTSSTSSAGTALAGPGSPEKGAEAASLPPEDAPPRGRGDNGDAKATSPVVVSPAGSKSLERWKRLLEQIPGPLTATFAAGRLMRWEGEVIELGYTAKSFQLQCAEDRQRQDSFKDRCSEKLGHPVRLQVRALTDEEESSPEVKHLSALQAKERERADHVVSLREEAENHPITRVLVDNFDARITRIQTEVDNG